MACLDGPGSLPRNIDAEVSEHEAYQSSEFFLSSLTLSTPSQRGGEPGNGVGGSEGAGASGLASDGAKMHWTADVHTLVDSASGPLKFLGLGGPDGAAHSLPALGVGASTGLGMHDLHVLRLLPPDADGLVGDGGSAGAGGGEEEGERGLRTKHEWSFPAVAYIQKGKPNKKALTFSRDVETPVALLVDAEEGLNVYESNVRRGKDGAKPKRLCVARHGCLHPSVESKGDMEVEVLSPHLPPPCPSA